MVHKNSKKSYYSQLKKCCVFDFILDRRQTIVVSFDKVSNLLFFFSTKNARICLPPPEFLNHLIYEVIKDNSVNDKQSGRFMTTIT